MSKRKVEKEGLEGIGTRASATASGAERLSCGRFASLGGKQSFRIGTPAKGRVGANESQERAPQRQGRSALYVDVSGQQKESGEGRVGANGSQGRAPQRRGRSALGHKKDHESD